MYFEKALSWNSLGIKNQLIYYKVKRFKASSCNPVFFMVLSFAALKVFFNMFFLKLRVKWRRLWKSNKNFEISVFNLKLFFFFRLDRVIFTTLFPCWPTFWNTKLKSTTLFRCCLTLITSMLKYTTLFQRWFEVAHVTTSFQQKDNAETTLKRLLGILLHVIKWIISCTFSGIYFWNISIYLLYIIIILKYILFFFAIYHI